MALGATAADAAWEGAGREERRARWVSPFTHLRGSSWHSGDSALILGLFCYFDFLVVVPALAALAGWLTRSRARTAAVVCVLLPLVVLQRALDIGLFETFVARPWIWLIMT